MLLILQLSEEDSLSLIVTRCVTCVNMLETLNVYVDMNDLVDLVVLSNDQTILPLVNKVIRAEYWRYTTLHNYGRTVAMDGLLKWLLDTPLLEQLDVGVLTMLFEMNFQLYEHYVIVIIEQCLKVFPFVCESTLLKVFSQFKMAQLLQKDRFLQAFRTIVQESMKVVGNHPVLMLLVIVSQSVQEDVTTVRTTDDDASVKTHDNVGDNVVYHEFSCYKG